MPELPEVETIKRDLKRFILDKRIVSVEVLDERVLNNCKPVDLARGVSGRTIQKVFRRGKAVILELTGPRFLMIQPKMTGQLIYGAQDKSSKVRFKLSDQNYLNYNDQRLFGRISLWLDQNESSFLNSLGPEPLGKDFSTRWLKENLRQRTIPIKTLLLNQNFVAGIGNIYASEILFRAKVSPRRRACSLRVTEIAALYEQTRKVLQEAIAWRGTSMRNYIDASGHKGNFMSRIKVYGCEGELCPVCRSPIKRIVQNARSTFYCRRCQK